MFAQLVDGMNVITCIACITVGVFLLLAIIGRPR